MPSLYHIVPCDPGQAWNGTTRFTMQTELSLASSDSVAIGQAAMNAVATTVAQAGQRATSAATAAQAAVGANRASAAQNSTVRVTVTFTQAQLTARALGATYAIVSCAVGSVLAAGYTTVQPCTFLFNKADAAAVAGGASSYTITMNIQRTRF